MAPNGLEFYFLMKLGLLYEDRDNAPNFIKSSFKIPFLSTNGIIFNLL
jgi:hypothetical protein